MDLSPNVADLQASATLAVASLCKQLRSQGRDVLDLSAGEPDFRTPNFAAEALPVLAQDQPFLRGQLIAAGYEWHPSPQGLNFCYQPLYFEDVNLERYGRSWGCLQPFVSAVHFYSKIPALPYMVFARPARRCTYHAHWTLPGYKIPFREPQPCSPSLAGAAAEVAVAYGIILLIP